MIIDFVPNHTAREYHSDVAPAGVRDFGCDDDFGKFFSPSNNYYYIVNQQFCPDFPLDLEGNKPYVEFPPRRQVMTVSRLSVTVMTGMRP